MKKTLAIHLREGQREERVTLLISTLHLCLEREREREGVRERERELVTS